MLRLAPETVDALVRTAALESAACGGARVLTAQDVARRAIDSYLSGAGRRSEGEGGAGADSPAAGSASGKVRGPPQGAGANDAASPSWRGDPVKGALLYWPGGKWRLGKWIASWFPAHDVYVEPFGGAASVMLRKEPSRSEVYNDLDKDLVALFLVLQSAVMVDDLFWSLLITKYEQDEFEEAYRSFRFFNSIETARRLVVRSLMGQGNSGAMMRKKAGFRPMTDATSARWYKHPERLASISARLRGVEVENDEAIPLMLRRDGADTLFYVDPPYLQETRSDDRYYRHEMTAEQHVELLHALRQLEGMVVLSGYRSELYDKLLTGWTRHERTTHTHGGRERVECVWLNPTCAHRTTNEGGARARR